MWALIFDPPERPTMERCSGAFYEWIHVISPEIRISTRLAVVSISDQARKVGYKNSRQFELAGVSMSGSFLSRKAILEWLRGCFFPQKKAQKKQKMHGRIFLVRNANMDADTLVPLLMNFRCFRYYFRGRDWTDSLKTAVDVVERYPDQIAEAPKRIEEMKDKDFRIDIHALILRDGESPYLRVTITPSELGDLFDDMIQSALTFEDRFLKYLGEFESFHFREQPGIREYGFDPSDPYWKWT